jgi:hypothetical protein
LKRTVILSNTPSNAIVTLSVQDGNMPVMEDKNGLYIVVMKKMWVHSPGLAFLFPSPK